MPVGCDTGLGIAPAAIGAAPQPISVGEIGVVSVPESTTAKALGVTRAKTAAAAEMKTTVRAILGMAVPANSGRIDLAGDSRRNPDPFLSAGLVILQSGLEC